MVGTRIRTLLAPLLAAAGLAACDRGGEAAPLPTLGQIAEFDLVNQRGEPFGQAALAGKTWVVNFVFTRCPSICPQMTQKMEVVMRKWRGEETVHFLSVSVDPAYDTPEVLSGYASDRQLDTRRWIFATGDEEEIRRLSLESFKLALGEEMNEMGDITHSSRFVLVDGSGRIRGYYHALDQGGLEPLHTDLETVLAEDG